MQIKTTKTFPRNYTGSFDNLFSGRCFLALFSRKELVQQRKNLMQKLTGKFSRVQTDKSVAVSMAADGFFIVIDYAARACLQRRAIFGSQTQRSHSLVEFENNLIPDSGLN